MTQNTSLMRIFIGNNQQQSTTFEETFQLEEMGSCHKNHEKIQRYPESHKEIDQPSQALPKN
jgi:hypothetical protein